LPQRSRGTTDDRAGSPAQKAAPCSDTACPLCLSSNGHAPVRGVDGRDHFHCPRCALIFTHPKHHLSRAEEEAHYRTHENGIQHQGYVNFLNRAIEPALAYVTSAMHGLDFGCGPVPTLSKILQRHGVSCDDYDPIFREVALKPAYDFIFATECFEHFFLPAREIRRLAGLLRQGGCLVVMTQQWTELSAFAGWHYARDPTHVSFYHRRTFEFICGAFGFEPLFTDGARVTLLRRTGGPSCPPRPHSHFDEEAFPCKSAS
jgi:uncharacterized C2H2 Zn-finger protein